MKLNKGFALVLVLVEATMLVATSALFAQETTAGLQGIVKDPQGAVISKAIVEVSSPAMIGVKKVETDLSGYYRFANLPPGSYTKQTSSTCSTRRPQQCMGRTSWHQGNWFRMFLIHRPASLKPTITL